MVSHTSLTIGEEPLSIYGDVEGEAIGVTEDGGAFTVAVGNREGDDPVTGGVGLEFDDGRLEFGCLEFG
jgi:hypothetical protein